MHHFRLRAFGVIGAVVIRYVYFQFFSSTSRQQQRPTLLDLDLDTFQRYVYPTLIPTLITSYAPNFFGVQFRIARCEFHSLPNPTGCGPSRFVASPFTASSSLLGDATDITIKCASVKHESHRCTVRSKEGFGLLLCGVTLTCV